MFTIKPLSIREGEEYPAGTVAECVDALAEEFGGEPIVHCVAVDGEGHAIGEARSFDLQRGTDPLRECVPPRGATFRVYVAPGIGVDVHRTDPLATVRDIEVGQDWETNEPITEERAADPLPDPIVVAWRGRFRHDVTVSVADPMGALRLRNAICSALAEAGLGYREAPITGGWEGTEEFGATFSFVSDGKRSPLPASGRTPDREAARVAFFAAIAEGCEAVQVEIWDPEGYRCEEWREASPKRS